METCKVAGVKKKSAAPGPPDRLCRRKRLEHTTHPRADLGSAWPDAIAPGNLQLEEPFHHRRPGAVALLFPNSFRQHQGTASGGFSPTPATARPRQVADHLGWSLDPSEQAGPGLYRKHRRAH